MTSITFVSFLDLVIYLAKITMISLLFIASKRRKWILTASRYLAAGSKCITKESSSNEEADFEVLKDKRPKISIDTGLKPAKANSKPIAKSARIWARIYALKTTSRPLNKKVTPSIILTAEEVSESSQITVNHFWEAKRCNAHPISSDVADQDYDSVTPQWLQQFLAEASYSFLTVPTLEKLNRVFAHNAGVRCALNTLCVACPVNAREHSAELLRYKKEMMKAFQLDN
jgi:hypothetical protein